MANWQSGCTQMQHVVVQQRVNSSISKDCPDEGTRPAAGRKPQSSPPAACCSGRFDLQWTAILMATPRGLSLGFDRRRGPFTSVTNHVRIMNTGVLSMSETERRIMRAAGLTTFIWSTEIAGGYGESSGPCRDSGYGRWLSACGHASKSRMCSASTTAVARTGPPVTWFVGPTEMYC